METAKWRNIAIKTDSMGSTQLLCASDYLPDLRLNVVLKVEM